MKSEMEYIFILEEAVVLEFMVRRVELNWLTSPNHKTPFQMSILYFLTMTLYMGRSFSH
jgi:hypothetical protein